MKDVFKSLFETAVEIPNRPENIDLPAAYMGPTIDLKKYVAPDNKTWNLKKSTTDTAGNAGLIVGPDFDATPAQATKNGNRIGYMYASVDTSATAVAAAGVGHVFGRLG